jgi:hypothetical protein
LLSAAILLVALSPVERARGQDPTETPAQNLAQNLAQNPAEAPAQNCAPTNIACRCSFQCCGEERCDGSICNQCVIDCVQRQQVVDRRSTSLRSRCQSLMSRGFKRL